jgi:plastocyanin
MPQALRWKLLPLAFVLALVVAACAEPPTPSVDVGSGLRFLPEVADSLNDAGRYPSIVTNPDGQPVVAYFGFEEELEEGEVPISRPVGSPSIPGVLLAGLSDQGYWTRGAIAIADEIPNVSIAFNPAFEPSVAKLTPQSVTGLAMVADGDTYHAVWASDAGVSYATGSLDPETTTQAQVTEVSSEAASGPSIALDRSGTPWISYYSSLANDLATVQLATPGDGGWATDSISTAAIQDCDTCRTAVVPVEGLAVGVAVAFGAGGRVWVASNDGENAWTSFDVQEVNGGQALSGTPTSDGLALTFYDGTGVTLATGSPSGPFDTVSLGDVADGSATGEGAGTSLAIGPDDSVNVAWVDSSEGVVLATGDPGKLEPVDTGTATVDGAFPSVAVNQDGSVTYLAWYATEEQDLLVGGYGEFEDVPFAEPSPTPTGPISTGGPPTGPECTPVQDGTVTVVAQGIAFTEGDCIEASAGEPFTIEFDNRDEGTQHNIEIFTGPEPSGDKQFEGDLVTGPDQVQYDVPALDAGEFAFNCVVHPTTMIGSVQVSEGGGQDGGGGGQGGGGGGQGGGGGGGATTTTVTASNIAFDTSTIDLPAGESSTIHFANDDAGVQHDIAIYPSADDLANPLFRGEVITGPDEIDYAIDPLEAGEYYFHCDIHPTMSGTVSVS